MSSEITDQAIPIRKGEELDLGALAVYLNDKLPKPGGQLEIQQFFAFARIRAIYDHYYRNTPTAFSRSMNRLLISPQPENDP